MSYEETAVAVYWRAVSRWIERGEKVPVPPGFVIEEFTAALEEVEKVLRPPKGHVLCDDGTVRKVLRQCESPVGILWLEVAAARKSNGEKALRT